MHRALIRRILKRGALWVLVFSASSAAVSTAQPFLDDHRVALVATLLAEEGPPEKTIEVLNLSRHIVRLSRDYELDPLLVLAIIKVESGFQTDARSPAGAIGLMQVMPIVIREVGSEISIYQKKELYDPYKNLHVGIYYLTTLLEKYEYSLKKALVAYNLGPSALDARLAGRGFIPLSYYRKVMRCYEAFRQRSFSPPIELT